MENILNAWEITPVENFDIYNDLSISIDNLISDITFYGRTPNNNTLDNIYGPAPTVYIKNELTLTKIGNGGVPCIIIQKTENDNVLNANCFNGNGSNYLKASWTQSSYDYEYSDYRAPHTESDQALQSLVNLFFATEAKADIGSYLTWEMGYQEFVRPMTLTTNIPILLVDSTFDQTDLLFTQFITHVITLDTLVDQYSKIIEVLNAPEPVIKPVVEYQVTCIANQYVVNEYQEMTPTTAATLYRGFRIKSRNPVSLYRIEGIDSGALKYGISFEDAEICYYSTDEGFNTWSTTTGSPTTLPFDFIWRYRDNDEIGTFYCADSIVTNLNLPIWNSQEDAESYLDGDKDITEAPNYSEISGNYPIDNPTGLQDSGTQFGEVKTMGFFSQQYVMDSTCLAALANDLFDVTPGGIWEDIKKGLDMYGDNPMDAVMGLSFWPIDLTTVYTTSTASYVWFGGYGWVPSGGNAYKLTYPNGYKTLGTIDIKRSFGNWRDWNPYTRLFVRLPYCGTYELDLTKYYGKTVEVRYYFDTRTNGCLACLIADGHLVDHYNGQCGVSMPMTLTDFSGYANAQIQTLLGFGGQTVSAGAGAISNVGSIATGAGSAALGVAGVGIAGAAIGAKTVYGLTQNNINKFNQTRGSSSSMINEYLPQYVEFIFEVQEDCAPDNYGQQYGYPSMKSGTVGSFQGFLKCQSLKLDCGVATENEKNTIKSMLLSGIYI